MAARLKAMALADIAAGKDPGRKRHYIEAIDDKGRWSGKLIPVPEALTDPLGWRKPRMVFVNSMSDLFHESIPDEFLLQVLTVMAQCPKWCDFDSRHTYQVLTKRADRMAEFMGRVRWRFGGPWRMPATGDRPLNPIATLMGVGTAEPAPNIWLGVSVEDRQRKARIDQLRETPAAVRFLSCEPLLEDLGELDLSGIKWVIVGGESGHGARSCDLDWIRSIVEQCRLAGVACFVKQAGSNPQDLSGNRGPGSSLRLQDRKGGDPSEWPEDLRVREFPSTEAAHA